MPATEGMPTTLPQDALFELRTIVTLSTPDARWVHREPGVIGKRLLKSLQDAGYIVEHHAEWAAGFYRPTDAGREAAR